MLATLRNPRGTRQAPRFSGPTLQAFIPFAPAWDDDVSGFSELLPESLPVYPMRGNVGGIAVFLEGREIGKLSAGMFTLTKVAAGDELRLVRSGRPEHVQRFPTDGLLLHIRLPEALRFVARQLAATPHAGAALSFDELGGRWATSNRLGPGFRERVYRVDRAKLTGLYLTSKSADPGSELTLID